MDASLVVTRLSSIYETEPVSEIEQPIFLNMVAEIGTPLPPKEQVMARLLRIEYVLGRTREVKDGPRTIDLDLLFMATRKSNSEFLTRPHPRLPERRFVLTPLAEIAPRLVHPVLKLTVAELLDCLADDSAVAIWHPH